MTVYGSLAAANTLFTAARAFLFAYGGICAATVVHKRVLSSVLKVPHNLSKIGFTLLLQSNC